MTLSDLVTLSVYISDNSLWVLVWIAYFVFQLSSFCYMCVEFFDIFHNFLNSQNSIFKQDYQEIGRYVKLHHLGSYLVQSQWKFRFSLKS